MIYVFIQLKLFEFAYNPIFIYRPWPLSCIFLVEYMKKQFLVLAFWPRRFHTWGVFMYDYIDSKGFKLKSSRNCLTNHIYKVQIMLIEGRHT